MAKEHIRDDILNYLQTQRNQGIHLNSADEITANVDASRATVVRYLKKLIATQEIKRVGDGPATRYSLASSHGTQFTLPEVLTPPPLPEPSTPTDTEGFRFSAACAPLIQQLTAPIGTRMPVTYQRSFVDNYIPNKSWLLPPALAADFFEKGRANGQQPAGTYARKVLEQLLIDLSWQSSRLEGNRKSLLDTKALFAKGRTEADDLDSTMLLNHKDAIEFIVDAVPEYGITEAVVRNIQALLMQGLLADPDAVGAIRRTVVNITDSVFVPAQAPLLLEEMLRRIVETARVIKNPIEAAFWLWINLAYLQPFQDGNKRTSRLCANLPLLLQNCAPLSFLDVDTPDYALAVVGVYEKQDVSLAVELFEWTYRRSIKKYQVILEAMGAPNPFRLRYREQLGDGVRQVVAEQTPVASVITNLGIAAIDQAGFRQLLEIELRHLEVFNCARYRIGIRLAEEWINAGRPGL